MRLDLEHNDLVTGLNFGTDEAGEDPDNPRRGGYSDLVNLNAVLNGGHNVITGRRGSGKTALRLQLAEHYQTFQSSTLRADSHAIEIFNRFKFPNSDDTWAKSLLWRYAIVMMLARYLVIHAEYDHNIRWIRSHTFRQLAGLLQDNNEYHDAYLYERVENGSERLRKPNFIGKLGITRSQIRAVVELPDSERIGWQLSFAERAIVEAVQRFGCWRHNKLLVPFDDMEILWAGDAESATTIAGLLIATAHMNAKMSDAVRFLVFLRTDTFDRIEPHLTSRAHIDKLEIRWSRGQLKELAETRGLESLGRALTAAQFWHEVLPRSIDGGASEDFILSRVASPRDLVHFLNLVRGQAQAKGAFRITETDVKEAEIIYSQWKLNGLVDEFAKSYPYFRSIYPLFRNAGYLATRIDLGKRYRQVRTLLRHQFPDHAIKLSADILVRDLCSIGFLESRPSRMSRERDNKHPKSYPQDAVFTIPLCFRTALGATEELKLALYTPSLQRAVSSRVAGHDWWFHPVLEGAPKRSAAGHSLLETLILSCQTAASELSESDAVATYRDDIVAELNRIILDTKTLETSIEHGFLVVCAPRSQIVHAIRYLEDLVNHLSLSRAQHSVASDYADILEGAATRLRRALRGPR